MKENDEVKLLGCPFESKIDKSGQCWNWTGAVQSSGYGNYRSKLAHRVSYEKYVGKIPEGLTIDHLCRNKICVNPDHLEVVSHYVNNMRGTSPTAINKAKAFCANGHDLSFLENVRVINREDGVRRACKVCAKIHKRKYKRKMATLKKEAAADKERKDEFVHLRLDWRGDYPSPKSLGIKYEKSVPQSMGDQTWYLNCTNVPKDLPDGYSYLELTNEELKHWMQ